ncbi:MAG: hypothetical protein ABSC65_20570 [Acidobacteriaceae bacterium]|jgi:hypothetical protein
MWLIRVFVFFFVLMLVGVESAGAQQTPAPAADASPETTAQLLEQLKAQDARLKELEAQVEKLKAAQQGAAAETPAPPPATVGVPAAAAPPATPAAPAADAAAATPAPAPAEPPPTQAADVDMGGHSMSIPGGPVIKFRGFFDFNFGIGSIANPLVFPIIDGGCGTCGNPITIPHTTFQAGEFDLFLTSKLSERLGFLAEIVLGPDDTNVFGLDIERYQLTYKANRYFAATAGRFHTSIGYYNTAYHHGVWFSTAEGRPIMYLFEDSGGILPVHMVGVNVTGAVPHTSSLGLHYVVEVGNGLSSNTNNLAIESVQNFVSDRNAKATNVAAYIRPERVPGLQIGGSWYHDRLYPTGEAGVTQNIESAYVVYLSPNWEFLNEAVMLSNNQDGSIQPFRSPMSYIQAARKFGIYKPYFRYQYVRDHLGDPLNLLQGTYYGPSVGLRIDFAEYAAFKLQYNHLYQSTRMAGNGLNAQVAFTF